MFNHMTRITAAFLCLCAAGAFAQFTPVTARVTQSVQITRDGKIVQSHVRIGTLQRSANGSELYRWESNDGKPIFEGSLKDNLTGSSYDLDFHTETAIERPGKPYPPGLLREDKAGDRPRESVEGVTCVVYTPPPPHNEKACWSIEHFLRLWQDITFPMQADPTQTYHMVARMSEIKLNANIDPDIFDVHKTFHVMLAQASKK